MKKFLCLLLAVCLVFSFAACTASDQPQDPDTDNPAAGDNAAGSENAGNTAGADTGKEDQDADPSGTARRNLMIIRKTMPRRRMRLLSRNKNRPRVRISRLLQNLPQASHRLQNRPQISMTLTKQTSQARR